MERHWIGTSWKMNKTLAEAEYFARQLRDSDATSDNNIQRFVIPPFTAVREVARILNHSTAKVGAQNMHWAEAGAWTGEVSAPMLTDCGMDIVEIGHSERRAYFGETDETVGLKTEAAVKNGLIPLICIGETLAEREAGNATEVLETQVRAALARLDTAYISVDILLAYEPVWAIGDGGIPATSDYADARQAEIIALASDIIGRRIPCLYGGSVDADNCRELIQCPHIDGLFIGRAAWNIAGYLDILERCAAAIVQKGNDT